MSVLRLFTGFWLLLTITVHYGQCCGPAEIGHEYTLTTRAKVSSGDKVEWRSSEGDVYYDSSNTTAPNFYPDVYIGSKTQITILNVTASGIYDRFYHYVNGENVYTCTLNPFKLASPPTFEPLRLAGNKIIASFTTDEVYPYAYCDFNLQSEVDERVIKYRDLCERSYMQHSYDSPAIRGGEYYNTRCDLRYPLDGLKPGNWTVKVHMYPSTVYYSANLNGTSRYADGTLILTVPTVNIDPNNCPKGLAGEGNTNVRNGYIKPEKRASCLCTRAHAGNPPGTIGWNSTHGGNFHLLSQSEDEAIIEIEASDTFTCRSSSVLDGSHSTMTYTPKYAYGPSEVTMTFAEIQKEPFNLCGSEGVDITVICAVKQSDVLPGLTMGDFTLTKPGGFLTKQEYLNTSGEDYRLVTTLKALVTGRYRLVCEARNPIFPDIKTTNSITVEVRRPPSDPPKMSARSSQHGDTVVVGDDVIVSCDVSHVQMSVQSVTLTCGQNSQYMTSNGPSVTLALPFVQQPYSQAVCTCRANLVTGCLIAVLNVTGVEKEDELTFNTIQVAGIAIGVFVGALLIVAAIALIVFFIRRGKAKTQKRNKKTDYDVAVNDNPPSRDVDVNQDESNYLTMKPSVPRSETTKKETDIDHIYSNQAIGRNTPVDPDGNIYNNVKRSNQASVKNTVSNNPDGNIYGNIGQSNKAFVKDIESNDPDGNIYGNIGQSNKAFVKDIESNDPDGNIYGNIGQSNKAFVKNTESKYPDGNIYGSI